LGTAGILYIFYLLLEIFEHSEAHMQAKEATILFQLEIRIWPYGRSMSQWVFGFKGTLLKMPRL